MFYLGTERDKSIRCVDNLFSEIDSRITIFTETFDFTFYYYDHDHSVYQVDVHEVQGLPGCFLANQHLWLHDTEMFKNR